MNVILVQRQQTSTKPYIYEGSTCISMFRLKELLNINQVYEQISLLSKGNVEEQAIDEYGFLRKDVSIPRWKQKTKSIGRGGYSCKGFCRPISKIDSRRVSYAKTKEFYCATCSIAMKCVRCRCCGRIGRREPRSRNRFTRAMLNGGKYIE